MRYALRGTPVKEKDLLSLLQRYATEHLEKIVGLALSNALVEHAKFMAHHMLLTCKFLLALLTAITR